MNLQSGKEQQVVIFDLVGVLLKFNFKGVIKHVGIIELLSYSIKHRRNPFSRLFDILHAVALKQGSRSDSTYKGKLLPEIIWQWHLGFKTSQEVLNYILSALDSNDLKGIITCQQEKTILKKITFALFDSTLTQDVVKPIKEGLKLLNKLKENNHRLFLLSNIDNDTFTIIRNKFPDLFDIFEEVIISAQVHMLKPSEDIYLHVLDSFNLNPNSCIFIDDQEENINAAKNLGINAILCDSYKNVNKKLINLGCL